MPDFADHFSGHAAQYADHRPHYPASLFSYLADRCGARHSLVWECGCGNGQASVALAPYFDRIVATDPSAAQLEHAAKAGNVEYVQATAEACPLPDASVDLVAVAQAAHWFDHDRFHAEVRRVLKRGGLLAIWGYGLHEITPAVDAVILRLYHEIVGPYWPARRRYIDEGLRTLPFPFPEIAPPDLAMDHAWTLGQLVDYIGTWSAVQRSWNENGADPRDLVRDDLADAWGDPETTRDVKWPLLMRTGFYAET